MLECHLKWPCQRHITDLNILGTRLKERLRSERPRTPCAAHPTDLLQPFSCTSSSAFS